MGYAVKLGLVLVITLFVWSRRGKIGKASYIKFCNLCNSLQNLECITKPFRLLSCLIIGRPIVQYIVNINRCRPGEIET